jgi:Flp pilus assembly protein TadD
MSEQKNSKRAEGPEDQAERVRQLVAEGAQLLGSRRPGEAVTKLTEARRLDPLNVPAAINLGGAYVLQGKFSQAIPVLEAAAQLEPDNVMIWTNLAAAYLGKLPFATLPRQEQAIQAYHRALDLDSQVPHVHYNLGLIYLERKDFQLAAAHFQKALETDPNDRDAQHYLDRIERGDLEG